MTITEPQAPGASPTRDLPRVTDTDIRIARLAAVRRVAELQAEEAITEDDAAARIARLTRHNLALTDEQRSDLHERLVEAVKRLSYIQSDMWDPAEGDRDYLELNADLDAEGAVRALIGATR